MAHPIMFDDDDPRLRRVREIALDLPGAAEKVSHGAVAFYTKKVFAYYGGSERLDEGYRRHDQSILVLPDTDERPALVADERFYHPMYLGPSGWVGMHLPPVRARKAVWDEVAELVDASYRNTAGKLLIRELDARRR